MLLFKQELQVGNLFTTMYNEILDVELGPNVLHNFFLSLKPQPISPAYSP